VIVAEELGILSSSCRTAPWLNNRLVSRFSTWSRAWGVVPPHQASHSAYRCRKSVFEERVTFFCKQIRRWRRRDKLQWVSRNYRLSIGFSDFATYSVSCSKPFDNGFCWTFNSRGNDYECSNQALQEKQIQSWFMIPPVNDKSPAGWTAAASNRWWVLQKHICWQKNQSWYYPHQLMNRLFLFRVI